MAEVEIDETQWPIVIVRMPRVVSTPEFVAYLAKLSEIRSRRIDYALVLDARASLGLSALHRRMQAEYIDAGIHITRTYLKGFAFVARHAFQRGALTAIFWLRHPAWPHRVFDSASEAKRWCADLLGLALEPSPTGPRKLECPWSDSAS